MTGNDFSAEGPLPDLNSVVALSPDHPPGQTKEFKETHRRARQYLQSQNWVAEIEKEYLGGGTDGIVFIFLFKIRPARAGVDSWIWVVVGDLPPAYLTCDHCKTPSEALDGYIGEMEEWVKAARTGASVAELIPVNVPATPANAEMLSSRLQFLEREILPLLE
jgi:hypothetical protein